MNRIRTRQRCRLLVYLFLGALVLLYVWLCLIGRGLPCLLYQLTGKLCPGCGASRAFLRLLRLDFAEAGRLNAPFAFAIYPIGLLIAGQDFLLCIYNLCRRTNHISFLQFLCGEREAAGEDTFISGKEEEG